jgi:broad specificity phosphatase PhoE
MPALLLVRHGQASFGAEDYDVLSETGHEQARALARELGRRRMEVTRVVSGGLVRQRGTIAPFASERGLEVVEDRRWDEYDTGDILAAHSATRLRHERPSGSDAPAVSSRAFQDVLEEALLAWIAAGDQGPAQETWPAFAARVDGALRAAAAGLGRGETAVVCTSGGVLAAVAVALLDVDPPAFVRFNRVAANAGISKVVVGRTGLTLLSYNEHGHLERAGDAAPLLTYR